MVPDAIRQLPRELWHAADEAWKCIMRFLARKELTPLATDEEMAKEAGWSESFMQKGFNALDAKMQDLNLPPLIIRERSHGRRQIKPGVGLKGDGTAKPASPPPGPPPEDTPDTTTQAPSSSSPISIGPEPPEPPAAPTVDPALIIRARRLLPKLNAGKVAAAILVYGPELVARALDAAEAHGKKDGAKPVHSWGFVLNTLTRMKRERDAEALAPPIDTAATAPNQAADAADLKASDKAAAAAKEKAEAEKHAALKATWDALPEAERAAIRTKVHSDHPGVTRRPNLLEPLYLAEMELRE